MTRVSNARVFPGLRRAAAGGAARLLWHKIHALVGCAILGAALTGSASFASDVGLQADGEPLKLYIDADFSMVTAPANAIALGLRVALSKADNRVAGHPIEIVEADHRGSPKRSNRTIQAVLRDPQAIAVVGGMQSPPYLTYGDFINESGLPVVLPWSAAGPLTRMAEGPRNHIFRLSVDDTQAGPFLVREALASGCENIALLLADTGWGRANNNTIGSALEDVGLTPVMVETVPSDIGAATGRRLVRSVTEAGADCILAVMLEATHLAVLTAVREIKPDMRLFSHWAILGKSNWTAEMRTVVSALDIRVLQTCGLQMEAKGAPRIAAALREADALGMELDQLSDVPASVGFVHGYDLGRILVAAIAQAAAADSWQNGPAARRTALRDALERLETPVEGILATYDPPFAPVDAENRNGHEALSGADLCLVRFENGKPVGVPRNVDSDG